MYLLIHGRRTSAAGQRLQDAAATIRQDSEDRSLIAMRRQWGGDAETLIARKRLDLNAGLFSDPYSYVYLPIMHLQAHTHRPHPHHDSPK
jgi:hypothetical protein